jgi:hypothetical protein
MTDIVERLRKTFGLTHDPDQLWDIISSYVDDRHEAADEIVRLRHLLNAWERGAEISRYLKGKKRGTPRQAVESK